MGDCPGRKSQVSVTTSGGLAVVVVSVGWPAKPSVLLSVPVKLTVFALTMMRWLRMGRGVVGVAWWGVGGVIVRWCQNASCVEVGARVAKVYYSLALG